MSCKLSLSTFAASALLGTGCMSMHSMVTGHSASVPGVGRAEVAVSPGIEIDQFKTTIPKRTPTASRDVGPSFEANVSLGLAESLGLNLHFSAEGIQPGVQILLVKGSTTLAILPEVAFGVGRDSFFGFYDGSEEGKINVLGFLAGAKAIVSAESGYYASVGYDFQYVQSTSYDLIERRHNFTAGLGCSYRTNPITIRPEVAFLYLPVNSVSGNAAKVWGWAIMPTLTLAAGSGH